MNLNTLSNEKLESCFENVVRSERKITGQVLECLAEIDRRKLYLEKGHTSLFDYLVKDFGYSPGAAMRRIDGARLLKELPEVAEKFENGTLTLSQATQVQRASRELKKTKNEFISSHQKRELVLQIENSSQKETEKTIAVLLDLPIISAHKEILHQDQSVTLTITLRAEQMQIIEQAQNMISHSVPNKNWADVFTYLAQKEITRRTIARSSTVRNSTTHRTTVQSTTPRSLEKGQPKAQTIAAATAVRGRAIPAKDRKKLLHSTSRCEHRDAQGRQCSSTRFLQIDHIQSWSRGGTHHLENLQVLCGVHNRLKYQKERNAPMEDASKSKGPKVNAPTGPINI